MDAFVSSQIAWGIIGVVLLAASIVWVVLCVKGKIPDPWSKWTLLVAGILGTFGGWLLWAMFTKRRGAPPPDPVVIVKKSPTEREIDNLDTRSENLDNEIKSTEEKLDELDKIEDAIKEPKDAENSNGSPADNIDPDDLNSDFGRRAREAEKALRGED